MSLFTPEGPVRAPFYTPCSHTSQSLPARRTPALIAQRTSYRSIDLAPHWWSRALLVHGERKRSSRRHLRCTEGAKTLGRRHAHHWASRERLNCSFLFCSVGLRACGPLRGCLGGQDASQEEESQRRQWGPPDPNCHRQ